MCSTAFSEGGKVCYLFYLLLFFLFSENFEMKNLPDLILLSKLSCVKQKKESDNSKE